MTETEEYSRAVETSACDVDELRTLFLFEKLAEHQLEWLCEHVKVERYEPGWIYREGEPGRCFYVVLDGTIAMSRLVGDDEVEQVFLARQARGSGLATLLLDEGERQVLARGHRRALFGKTLWNPVGAMH